MEAKRFYGWLKAVLIGVVAAVANNVIILPSVNFISGLYLDTIFTAAAAFAGGIVSGLVSAVLTTVLYGLVNTVTTGTPYFGAYYLYMLCSIAVVLLIRLFARFFPAECETARVVGGQESLNKGKIRQGSLFFMLATLSLVMCVVTSILGGLFQPVLLRLQALLTAAGRRKRTSVWGLSGRALAFGLRKFSVVFLSISPTSPSPFLSGSGLHY